MRLSAGEVAKLVAGSIASGDPNAPVEGVSIDSRRVEPGQLFFAIVGPRHDGHDFVSQAIARGACGIVASSDVIVGADAFVVRVADTTRALQDLAAAIRDRAGVQVVAITGSMGKTTTKDAAAAAIATRHRVLKSEGNLNNHYGLPLSLLRLGEESVAVLEMGMSAPGEIARLCEIAKPDVSVLTNVAEAHLEFFGTVEAIAEAKGEIFVGLKAEGVAVVNADDPLVLEQAKKFSGREIRFGLSDDADVRGRVASASSAGVRFTVERGRDRVEVSSPLPGRHNVYNLLAGLAAASALDVPIATAARGLKELSPAHHRGERLELAGGVVVIDETYNSNPRALRAALDLLSTEPGRRHLAVIGDMLELGGAAEELHRRAGRDAASRGVDVLIAVGGLADSVLEGAKDAGIKAVRLDAVRSAEEAGALVKGLLREGDVVLFKGSRGVGLERAVEIVRAGRAEGESA
ncbi:MAG TPA: UDP-N-acetylmuramoyl-tripeptide--D-alanyl-D-alanine ligase [Vicinamibacteria bacterium]|nr:UDP-N-acetylmuramoyl-tripeptide--D-alanyl-D-alanine ligase [Vicinamibacteria bacterium]